jgi:DegV family protein with EDD domain
MKFGVMVDSACDLPASYLAQRGVVVAPIVLNIDGNRLLDWRDPELTASVYANQLAGEGAAVASTEPPSADQLRELLQTVWTEFDRIHAIALSSTRSPTYQSFVDAIPGLMTAAVGPRHQARRTELFNVHAWDSRTLFAAQGVQVLRLFDLIEQRLHPEALEAALAGVIANTLGLMVPSDLEFIYKRARQKNDNSVSWLSFTLGSWLNVRPVIEAIDGQTAPVAKVRSFEGAVANMAGRVREMSKAIEPILNVSYGGPAEQLKLIAPYQELKQQLLAAGFRVFESHMSLTAGINVGRGALCFGLIRRH